MARVLSRTAVAIVAVLLIGSLARPARAEEIREILVEDNKKTTSDTVELIAQISVGDDWNVAMVDQIKQRLVTSGLFKDVEVFWDPVQGGVRVHILVKDKHSWVIAPTFYNQPTNTGGGVGFAENNLFGENQKLLLYGQIATGDSFFIGAWVVPSIGGTRFYTQFDTFLKSSRNIEYAPPTGYLDAHNDKTPAVRLSRINYLNAGFKLGVEPFRGIKIDARLRGAHVGYSHVELADGATPDQVFGPGPPPTTRIPKPGIEGWDVSNELSLTIDRIANWYGVRTGHKYQASYEYALPPLGSDFHYWELGVQLLEAVQVFERHNFILKGAFHYGHHMPFQQEFLSGGTSMRGWLNNQFRGDFQVAGTAEYSVPLFTIQGLGVRGLAFWDSAYTTFVTCGDCSPTSSANSERNYLPNSGSGSVSRFAPFKNSVGIGTRLFMRQIVIPLLGIDLGYGLEARDFQVYLAIGLTD